MPIERKPIDWNKIVERVAWAAVTIATVVYGTGQKTAKEYEAGQADWCQGVIYEGKSAAYYKGNAAERERAERERQNK